MEITAELVETSTEARCGFTTFEAAHRSLSSLDPAMVLLDPVIQILVRPVFHAFVHFGPDRAWVTVMTIRRGTRRGDAGHGFLLVAGFPPLLFVRKALNLRYLAAAA
jgi:hypothetical protein